MGKSAYAASGVDIKAGALFVEMISKRIADAWPDKKNQIGGFAGEFHFPQPTDKATAGTDGTGTLAILGALCERFSVIGHNAAAMSLVDVYVSGAMPVAMLDVIDVAKLVPDKHISIVDGLIAGCKLASPCVLACVIVGGETAELPDMFRHGWMVHVNTTVIGWPNSEIVTRNIRPGQTVWGWSSEGPASNGFSLIRDALKLRGRPSHARVSLERNCKELGMPLIDALVRPAPIWVNQMEIQRSMGTRFAGHAHITGGGLVENIPRILPNDCKVVLDRSSWVRPPVFALIQQAGGISDEEMDKVFNQGLIVVSIHDPAGKEPNPLHSQPIGLVEKRNGSEPQVEFTGAFTA